MTALTEVTRLLLADNIHYRLVTSGLSVDVLENDFAQLGLGTTVERDTTTDKVRRSMRFLCTELYQKHETELEDMLKKLHIVPNTLHVELKTVMASVFYDQINWGRIATLVAFCSVLAEQCVKMEMIHLIPRIIDWATSFVDTQLRSWIVENNGWVGIVSFCDPDCPKSWSSLKNVCGYVVAVGLFNVLSLFSSYYRNSV